MNKIFPLILSIIMVLVLVSVANASPRRVVRYNMCPCVQYDFTPVETVLSTAKEVVKPAVKAVKAVVKPTTKVVRQLVGYSKVCGPRGCSMQPVYKNVTVVVSPENKK